MFKSYFLERSAFLLVIKKKREELPMWVISEKEALTMFSDFSRTEKVELFRLVNGKLKKIA